MFKYINQTYGGDLVFAPGDSNGGKWYEEEYMAKHYPGLTPEEVVMEAGKNCYGRMKHLFTEAGYDQLLIAIGDHELGGNNWQGSRVDLLPAYRKTFANEFNTDADTGQFLYQHQIGSVTSRPIGTPFNLTSYAYQYKNVLFITVDAFVRLGKDEATINVEEGTRGEGEVTCTMRAGHLRWFNKVLNAGKKDRSIQYIFVQSHIPVLQSVRKINTSGQFFDYAERSAFWKAMVDYGVDVYFAGDVHANTASIDPNSDLVQVVSRGNGATNFLKVEVKRNHVDITAYNQVGILPRGENMNHTEFGHLTIRKDGKRKEIQSSGALKLLDSDYALLNFDFETILPLGSREIVGLSHDFNKQTVVASQMTVRDIVCESSIWNNGTFGQQYDAQVANLALVDGIESGNAIEFNESSIFAIASPGPYSAGNMVSFALWIKTDQRTEEMISTSWKSLLRKLYEHSEEFYYNDN